ncbi:hypothetical protein PACILC2_50980 [Paenibacillus cisolokensis]|uniref:Uncharacterized protein n=1 Tax=Paenibacillus cisolokensis TaxID=1658519 RepID=A0ABQ4NE92_9BACL|nr:hypothetical protein PACILC2_50980 [Paenibacillus cisolokensis]
MDGVGRIVSLRRTGRGLPCGARGACIAGLRRTVGRSEQNRLLSFYDYDRFPAELLIEEIRIRLVVRRNANLHHAADHAGMRNREPLLGDVFLSRSKTYASISACFAESSSSVAAATEARGEAAFSGAAHTEPAANTNMQPADTITLAQRFFISCFMMKDLLVFS